MTQTVEEAIEHARWHTVFALDMLGCDGRKYDPRVTAALTSARPMLERAAEFSKPEHDQRVVR